MTVQMQEEKADGPLNTEELRRIDAYWRAANYLAVGQIYLLDNPLLREPLRLEHVKPRLLGHWGTTPGQNFVYVHVNRIIKKYNLNMIYISGPGHGGPAVVAILHLNGYKIANPTVLARINHEELEQLLRGYGYLPYFVEGHEPETMHQLMASTLDTVVAEIQRIQSDARTRGVTTRPRWP